MLGEMGQKLNFKKEEIKVKSFRIVLIGLVLSFCLLTFVVSSNIQASEYLGEFCWDVVSWGDRPNYVMKLGATHMGGGYYIAQGSEQVGQDFVAWFGSAQVVGTQIRVSVHETHSNSQPIPTVNADHSGCQWFLDSTTLNGNGWCTTAHYDLLSPNDTGVSYSTGTFTYTNCP